MSKFENLLNSLWENYPQPGSTNLALAGTNPAATSTTPAPAPSPTGANPTSSTATTPPGTPNTINKQQPQQNKSQPTTTPITDPNHNAIKAIAGITDPNKLAQFLKDPKSGVQLVATANK